MKIALTSVFVNNPADAFQFYTNVLGFKERLFVPEMHLAIVASPEEPGSTGLLLEPNDNPIARTYQEGLYKSGIPAIVFGVDDIFTEYERLKQSGVIFRKAPVTTDWGIETNFEDGCGNLIQLAQIKKGDEP
jgi:catechol 2,3-dioxygenase-like lactoylglutathione lyase family enzyme